MNSYDLSLVLALACILMGVYLQQLWIGCGLAVVVFVILAFQKRPAPKPKPAKSPATPKTELSGIPKEMLDFYKRGTPGNPMIWQEKKYKPEWHETIADSVANFTRWLSRFIGKQIKKLF